MTLSFIRAFFVFVSGIVGYYIGTLLELQNKEAVIAPSLYGAMIGCLAALFLILVELKLKRVSVRGLSSLVFGLLLGVFMAKMIANILRLLPVDEFILSVSELVLTLVFSYMGAVIALRGKDEFNVIIPYVKFKRQELKEGLVLLDTSALIDGRVADIFRVNFIPGRMIVPRSVLEEMQKLADSANDLKREKGRRGMEILRNMQKDSKIPISIHEDDTDSHGTEVDTKLINLAKMMDASICTTDFNLGRIAAAQGIDVLNINELANAVKMVVFSGEKINIRLIKEGKEPGQAVGYIDDGTMVVVGEARRLIGQKADVVVSSVLQTQAGKIIFAKLS
ncbi:MAG: PIN domain nuclease [Candidatus Omnitrophica bacterium]|nr:PIN domain nuclease [Candidatus Omnitrophota bacterium]